ncbi:class I SAM-dependent methyltransferase [Luteolibacter algae]|uniref:Class I SAM-dependent methyltransferase n=1 Tax=Luteolibacter algae TaxID=454151 RepID=A0ABW5D5Y8_9BACT
MSDRSKIAKSISTHCAGLWLPNYTSCKLKTDPLYDGVYTELVSSELPLLDIGCGLGILSMYLRERGWKNPVTGFDFDSGKITGGRVMLQRGGYQNITLSQGDARAGLPDHLGDVTILDILQFFTDLEQEQLLRAAASKVAPGGKLIIRSGLYEKNTRFYTTVIADMFAKCTFWMKAAPVRYPTAEFFKKTLAAERFAIDIRPFWGKTPFNNYLIVATRGLE